jgi:formylmethanofuran dehydrogenase subunit A
MFAAAAYLFRRGELVVRDGEVVAMPAGRTHAVGTEFDRDIERRVAEHFERHRTMRVANFVLAPDEIAEMNGDSGPVAHAARRR